MRLLIVRHAEPSYENDSLTEKGFREAELLSKRLVKEDVKAFYMSPLGRAVATAKPTLEKLGREAEILPWLREFEGRIVRPSFKEEGVCWDWLPQDFESRPDLYDVDKWLDDPDMSSGNVREKYEDVIKGFDALLAKHGYERDGRIYKAVKPNRDTIVLFCHFGLECVLLSRLMNVSPFELWHHFSFLPSSVTTIYTEERRPGKVIFRATSLGDISHLYEAGEEPSFMVRFCETFDSDERHD